MSKVSERVLVMKSNFMRLHQEGYSILEIAKQYDLCKKTMYRHLQEIADENGISRNALLKIVRTQKTDKNWREEETRVRADAQLLKDGFSELINMLEESIGKIEELEDVKYDI